MDGKIGALSLYFKTAFGIDKILYKCPCCKEEHVLYVEGEEDIRNSLS